MCYLFHQSSHPQGASHDCRPRFAFFLSVISRQLDLQAVERAVRWRVRICHRIGSTRAHSRTLAGDALLQLHIDPVEASIIGTVNRIGKRIGVPVNVAAQEKEAIDPVEQVTAPVHIVQSSGYAVPVQHQKKLGTHLLSDIVVAFVILL